MNFFVLLQEKKVNALEYEGLIAHHKPFLHLLMIPEVLQNHGCKQALSSNQQPIKER